jgi:hypothetical protein
MRDDGRCGARDELDAILEEAAGRSTRLSPTEAAQRVVRRLPDHRRARFSWTRVALLAASVALVVLGSTWMTHVEVDERPSRVGTVIESPVMGPDVVVSWLDDQTPVYFVLGTAPGSRGETP